MRQRRACRERRSRAQRSPASENQPILEPSRSSPIALPSSWSTVSVAWCTNVHHSGSPVKSSRHRDKKPGQPGRGPGSAAADGSRYEPALAFGAIANRSVNPHFSSQPRVESLACPAGPTPEFHNATLREGGEPETAARPDLSARLGGLPRGFRVVLKRQFRPHP